MKSCQHVDIRNAVCKKSLLRYTSLALTAIAILCPCLTASAQSITLSSADQGFPIRPSTAYNFVFNGATPPTSDGVLTISETNGDFNNSDESITVSVEGYNLGTLIYTTDNAPILRTLSLDIPLPFATLSDVAADSVINLTVTTSAGVNQSAGMPGGPPGTSFLHSTITYETVPEPCALSLFVMGACLLPRHRRKP
jgi:hypothetical protein